VRIEIVLRITSSAMPLYGPQNLFNTSTKSPRHLLILHSRSVQPGAQVTDESNTIIQVDWTFSTGPDAGKTEKRWMFLQDGATIQLENGAEDANSTNIKGRFSSNGDVAATLKAFRKGWVGVVGPHPEATKDWCRSSPPDS